MSSKVDLREHFKMVTPEKASARMEALTPQLIATTLGMKNFTQIGRKGDLLCFLTEVKLEGMGNKAEPALVLAHQNNPLERHVYILLSQMWQFAEPRAMNIIAPQLAEKLYGFVTKQDCYRIIDAFYDFADDLRKAPPPSWMTAQDRIDALARDGWLTRRNGKVMEPN